RAVAFAVGKVDIAHEAAEQPRRVNAGTAADFLLEGEAGDRQAAAAVTGVLHGTVEVAPERGTRAQAGFRIRAALAVERFEHPLEMALKRLQANHRQYPFDQKLGVAVAANE